MQALVDRHCCSLRHPLKMTGHLFSFYAQFYVYLTFTFIFVQLLSVLCRTVANLCDDDDDCDNNNNNINKFNVP